MLIDHNILIAYGGSLRKLDKGSVIYNEGDYAHNYYQVVEGEVKLASTNSEGRELIQGIYRCGESFGTPALLLNKPYSGIAQTNCITVIMRLHKEGLLAIMSDIPSISNKMLYEFAERLHTKALSVQVWAGHTPEEKICTLLNQLKEEGREESAQMVPYTRQQIADFTGLRVETVIRTLTRMNAKGIVNIINRKVYY